MNKLICIVCPRGCHLEVDEHLNVKGNFCPRGVQYAKNELTFPKRKVTSTIEVIGGNIKRVSVITDNEIPKELIFELMNEIKKVKVHAPLKINSVVIENALGLGVNVITTKEVLK
jgi:CxxC motif-containing protein